MAKGCKESSNMILSYLKVTFINGYKIYRFCAMRNLTGTNISYFDFVIVYR